MRLRSLLFVPGDRLERLEKAIASGTDAVILDLEDSVSLSKKAEAREAVAQSLRRPRTRPLLVRVNPLDSGLIADDLTAVLSEDPDGIVLPKAEGAQSLDLLFGLMGESCVPVLPIATETPAAVFELGSYARHAERLLGLTWGAEDLPAAIGATSAREADGRYTPPMEMVRALALFGAHKAGVPAIETVYPDFRNLEGLAAYAAQGRRDGFSAMMAIHPAQIAVINQAFMPSETEIEKARMIIAAFEASPGVGALQIKGRMIDAPHLKQARHILKLARDG